MPNFNFLAPLVTDIWRGSQNKKVGANDLPRRPLADKFLHRAIVPAIAYQCTKFQLPSSISSRDMEEFMQYKLGLLFPHTRPLADKFLCRALLLVNVYKYAKFQLPSSISYGYMEGVPK